MVDDKCFIKILLFRIWKSIRILIMKLSFRKSNDNSIEEEELAGVATRTTIPAKIPRKGLLGKMGLKKKDKSIKIPLSNVHQSVVMDEKAEDVEPKPFPNEEESQSTGEQIRASVVVETVSSADEGTPHMDEDDQPVSMNMKDDDEELMKEDERDEKQQLDDEPKNTAMDPVPVQTDDVSANTPVPENLYFTDEREQPKEDNQLMMNPTGFLCGCV